MTLNLTQVSLSTSSKVLAWTDSHTKIDPHRHDENITSTVYAGGNKIKSDMNILWDNGACTTNILAWL